VIVVSLFPLSSSPDPQVLKTMAPGIIWVATLLASLSAIGRLFGSDYCDGTLEQMLLIPQSLYWVVLGKVSAQFIFAGLPLVIAAPLVSLQLGLAVSEWWTLIVSLALGIPVFLLIGSIGAALTLGLRAGNILVSLLSLPLVIPALVFGAGALQSPVSGAGVPGSVLLLAALFILTVTFAPCATAAALRISLE
jgi:heme exporter protein B